MRQRRAATGVDEVGVALANADGPGEDSAANWRERGAAFHFLADFLVDARDTDKDRGADFLHRLRQLVELGAVGHLRPALVHDVIERAGGDVRKRQK